MCMWVCVCEALEVKRVVMHVMLTPVPQRETGDECAGGSSRGLAERKREREGARGGLQARQAQVLALCN